MLYANAPKNTLARATKGTTFSAHIDRTPHRLRDSATALLDSKMWDNMVHPEHVGVPFYVMNEAVAHLHSEFDSFETLPEKYQPLLEAYSEQGALLGARMYWYVLLICARELRHASFNFASPAGKAAAKAVQEEYGLSAAAAKACVMHALSYPGDQSSALNYMATHTPAQELAVGPFCKAMSVLFHKGTWPGSYGGPKWGVIADAVHNFVKGEWSAEMFCDTAFTLEHNTCAIFNKSFLFYQSSSILIEILDCQRAGTLCQWVGSDGNGKSYQTLPLVGMVKSLLPELFEGAVDWEAVEKLGALGSYAHKIPANVSGGKKLTGKTIQVDYNTVVQELKHEREAQ